SVSSSLRCPCDVRSGFRLQTGHSISAEIEKAEDGVRARAYSDAGHSCFTPETASLSRDRFRRGNARFENLRAKKTARKKLRRDRRERCERERNRNGVRPK